VALPLLEFLLLRVFLLISCDNYTVAGPGIPVVACIPAVACKPALAGIPAFADGSAFADLFTLSVLLLPAS
jgi:hypothetical protein